MSAAEGQGRDEGDVRGDEVWSGVGLVRVLPVRRTEARGGQGTIRRDFYAKDGGADGCPCLCHEGSLHEA